MPRSLILLVSCLLLAPLYAKETEERLALAEGDVCLPTEPKLGVVEECPPRVGAMMGEEYSLAWLEEYVQPQVRQSFSQQFGQLLASLLPITGALYGRPVASGPYLLVPVRLADGRYLTLCMQGEFLVSLSISG